MSTVPEVLVSHYRLLERLGQGGMGEVWLAEDTQLPRRVAVKLLAPHLAGDPEAVERMLREARAAASVDHPAVVTVYEAGVQAGRPYIVMQRVEGETLEARLARGPLAIGEAAALARTIADALAEVHALGIVHRDLKPANVVMSARGPRVLDFGIASVKGASQLTGTGTYLGTPLYMSPEQLKGQAPDNRSDLWALGVILYQCLTGVQPFAAQGLEAVAHRVLTESPPPPSRLRPEIGSDLDYMVGKLLRKDPAHRYGRAEDLVNDLATCEACVDAGPPRAEAGKPRLAVLPFELLSSVADDAFLAEGLAEDLIVDLSRVQALSVVSRAELAALKDRQLPPRTLGRELGADHLLQGSVRRAGQRARISAQLVRAQDGHVLWAERFDRTLEDLFEVQAEVSKRIVEALQVTLGPGEREMLDRAPTANPDAYYLYLQARQLMGNLRADNWRAEELLERALALDPNFALAHAALGEVYAQRAVAWWAGTEAADRAETEADRALALEPGLVEAELVKVMVHRIRGEAGPMLRALERLSTRLPDHPFAVEWAGWGYMVGDQLERAREVLERGAARHPDHFPILMFLGDTYENLHRREDARRARLALREVLIDRLRRFPDDHRARSVLGALLAASGEKEAGLAQIERARAQAPEDGRVRYNLACAYATAGETERAIEELKGLVGSLPNYLRDWPPRDPWLANVHRHAEFLKLFGRP